jgi:hypothetical protein
MGKNNYKELHVFTKDPFILNRDIRYEVVCARKPLGLWVSDQHDDINWPQWCVANYYNIHKLRFKTCLNVDITNVLVVDTEKKMEELQDKWSYVEIYRGSGPYLVHPDWDVLSQEYKGNIISPYQDKYRLDLKYQWYYGWDCASGCLWNLDCIKEVGTSEEFYLPLKGRAGMNQAIIQGYLTTAFDGITAYSARVFLEMNSRDTESIKTYADEALGIYLCDDDATLLFELLEKYKRTSFPIDQNTYYKEFELPIIRYSAQGVD